jgi:ornithine cyclodeaminase/alanine dehydrogenase
MVLFLSKSQITSLLSMRESIDAVEEAFREFELGTATMPTRVGVTIPEKQGWLGVMPAYLERAGSLTTKIVTVYENNVTRYGIPNVLAAVILNDVETGRVEAIMEGSQITAMRTGAVSGVATKYLARTDAKRLGIFGAGVQARRQFQAVREVREIRSVSVYDTRKEMTRDFIAEATAQDDVKVSVASTPEEVVRESDIIVTATTSATPVFNGRQTKPGTHINAIGAFTPSTREVDNETISTSKIVVDSLDAALAEAGDIIIPMKEGIIQRESIWAELGEIVTGKKPGRISEEEKTLFKSVGLGIQDAAVALVVFKKALSLGVGTRFDLDS